MDTLKPDQKIYLIDDDTMITESFSANLSRHYDLQCFNSAKDALVTLADNPAPKVIISDLQMPDLDGLSFIEKLREKNKDCKIIVASGSLKKDDALRAVNLGIFAFIEKPYTSLQLQELVSKAMDSFTNFEKTHLLLEDMHTLAYLYSQLGEQYYERIMLLENNAYEKNVKLLSKNEDIKKYLQGISRENSLDKEIDRMKNEILSLSKIIKQVG